MILVLNAGSSSLRCALFRPGADEPAWRAHVADIGRQPRITVDGIASDGERPPAGDHATVARWLFERLPAAPSAAGHRVVHGGTRHAAPVRLDADVMLALERPRAAGPGAPAPGARLHPGGRRDLAGPAAGRLLRHRLPPDAGRGWPNSTRCRAPSSTRGSCASAFTGCPTPISPGLTRAGGSWPPISATGRACARSGTGAASPRRWASRRSTG